MNQFVQRVANYVANEVIIKGLANSKTFQRFAVRTDANLKQAQQKGEKHVNAAWDELAKAAGNSTNSTAGRPIPPARGVAGFVAAFWKEVGTDLGIVKRK